MRVLATFSLISALWLAGSPVYADGGESGFWITIGQPATPAALAVLYGAFCALWAQNTGRNAWLWFIVGAIFNILTVAVLLYKNAEDRRTGRSGQVTATSGRGG